VELLVEGGDVLLDLSLKFLVLLTAGEVELFLGDTDRREEVGDLVRILARGGHLDGAGPIEVEVAQGVGQLLNF